jgi:hypothetical protein
LALIPIGVCEDETGGGLQVGSDPEKW